MIVIEGTNASGKSALGVKLAKRFGGEVISADSRQVYRRLDLGSGKITPEETDGVPHHLLDAAEPGEFFSMADFQRLAYEAADDIISRGKVPFMVGGTGLYIDAVADGYVLSDRPPDLELRQRLEEYDTSDLYRMLKEKIPDTDIDPRNRHRVMRALEKIEADDFRPGTKKPKYEVLRLGVTWPRETLKKRIDERLERRLEQGMCDEVRGMLDDGVSKEFLLKLGLEYRYLTLYLTGEIGYEQMKDELARAIKRFAKRQMIWFRRHPDTVWLDMGGDPEAQAAEVIGRFMEQD